MTAYAWDFSGLMASHVIHPDLSARAMSPILNLPACLVSSPCYTPRSLVPASPLSHLPVWGYWSRTAGQTRESGCCVVCCRPNTAYPVGPSLYGTTATSIAHAVAPRWFRRCANEHHILGVCMAAEPFLATSRPGRRILTPSGSFRRVKAMNTPLSGHSSARSLSSPSFDAGRVPSSSIVSICSIFITHFRPHMHPGRPGDPLLPVPTPPAAGSCACETLGSTRKWLACGEGGTPMETLCFTGDLAHDVLAGSWDAIPGPLAGRRARWGSGYVLNRRKRGVTRSRISRPSPLQTPRPMQRLITLPLESHNKASILYSDSCPVFPSR